MSNFTHIKPEQLTENVFNLIGKDWMLVTSANNSGDVCGQDYNTMTASWGGVGILWNKPVVFVFIRPQRHTFRFTEMNDRMTLSFFDESYRSALTYCGRFSGSDVDKVKECGLTPVSDTEPNGRAIWFEEAKLVIKTSKLYEEYLDEVCFCDPTLIEHYKNLDFHKMYIGEIDDVLVK